MAISVIQQPAAVALAKNPMWVKLETDNYVTTAGVEPLRILSFTGNPAADDTLQFVFPDGTDITMTWKASPDSSGIQVRTNGGALALAAYLELLAADFRSNYTLNERFEISVQGGAAIWFLGREKGLEADATLTENVTNATLSGPTAGVATVVRDNFQIIIDVYVEDTFGSGTYTRVAKLEGIPDDEDQAEWDIADIVLAHLEPDLPVIGAGAAECSNILKSYYYRYAETYGDPAEIKLLYNGALDARMALLAGVRFDAFPASTFLADHITETDGRKLLTTQPREKDVLTSQKEWLYYYNDLTTGTLKIKVTISYSDSSTASYDIETIASPENRPYLFPAGHDQLDLVSYDTGKTILSWEIWVEHSGGNTSESMFYTLDRRAFRNVKYFLFQNSAGGMDTVCCTGEQEERIEVKSEAVETYVPNGYTGSDAQLSEAENEYTDLYSVATGYKTAEYLRYLRDLFLSPHVYEITADGLRRIILDRDKMALVNTEDDVTGLVLVYRYGYENCAYSS